MLKLTKWLASTQMSMASPQNPSTHMETRGTILQGTLRFHGAPGHKAPKWQNCDLTQILVWCIWYTWYCEALLQDPISQ